MSHAALRTPKRKPTRAEDTPRSLYRKDDDLVLQSFVRKSEKRSGQGSRFGAATWDLTPVAFRENLPRKLSCLDFSTIADPQQQLTAKEYLWTRLNDCPIAGVHRARLAPTAASNTLSNLLRFMRFIAERAGRFNMRDVDQPLLDAYLAHVRSVEDRSPNTILKLISIPIDLHRHAGRLTLGGFSCRPWSGRSPYRIVGHIDRPADRGNRTARIPEAVIAPLLRRATQYVELFSTDILAARAELDALQSAKGGPQLPLPTRLAAYLFDRTARGRGIPMTSSPSASSPRRIDPITGTAEPPINYALIALQLGCPTTSLSSHEAYRQLIVHEAGRLGLEIGGLIPCPRSIPRPSARGANDSITALSSTRRGCCKRLVTSSAHT
jgi:hypothetical protein